MEHAQFAIINLQNVKKASGGPTGYLYNLFQGYSQADDLCMPSFYYIDNNVNHENASYESKGKKIKDLFPGLRFFIYYIKKGIQFKRKAKKQIETLKYIHVHTSDAVIYLRLFSRFNGSIIFTPHRPERIKDEIVSRLVSKKKGNYIFVKYFLDWIEEKSYKMSNAFIFPCSEAREIYNAFPGFITYTKNKPVEYVYTGIQRKEITITKEEYRKTRNIPLNSFLIGYIGRHNEIKGYDRLTAINEQLAEKDIEVLVAGDYSTVDVPTSNNWHELGYITDAQNFMNACDAIVVPNRNTYFDLVIVEALSYGRIVITSNTGGNRNLANETDGIVIFDNDKSNGLFDAICQVKNLNKEIRKTKEENALNFFSMNCTCLQFAHSYDKAITRIIETLDYQ